MTERKAEMNINPTGNVENGIASKRITNPEWLKKAFEEYNQVIERESTSTHIPIYSGEPLPFNDLKDRIEELNKAIFFATQK